MAGTVWAEDEIGRKWDRCFTDALFKLGKYYLIRILVILLRINVKDVTYY